MEPELLQTLKSIDASLRSIAQTLKPQELGFCESPRRRKIFANRSNNCLWYFLDDEMKVVPIVQTAISCYIEKLEFQSLKRRGKDVWKTLLHIRADRPYVVEAGHDSNFTKCLLSALAACSPEWLKQPIVLEVQSAESEEVLFCRIYANGDLIFAPWNEETNWRTTARLAIQAIESANGNTPVAA